MQATVGLGAAVEHHAEATIDDFAPAYAAAVVDADPRGAAEAVADDVLDGHVGSAVAAVVDVAGLAEGAVGTADVVVVATKDDGGADLTLADGLVEAGGNLGAALAVGVEDTGLAANNEVVLLGCDEKGYLNGKYSYGTSI